MTTTKLTLSIQRSAVDNGKRYARQSGRSLSSLVNDYLTSLRSTTDTAEGATSRLSPTVTRLMGIGRGPTDEKDYRRHLAARQS